MATVALGVGEAAISPASAGNRSDFQPLGDFGKWTLFCVRSPASNDDCALAQASEDAANEKNKLKLSISFEDNWDLAFKVKVEPKPEQSEEIAILVDGLQTAVIQPGLCDSTGCAASFHPSTELLARALHGSELEGQFRVEPTVGLSLGLDLPGLQEGLLAMRAKLPARTEEDWVASSSNATSSFKVNLVNSNDLPKDKILDLKTVKAVFAISSALIECDHDHTQSGERRPSPVNIKVNSRFQVDYIDTEKGLKALAETLHKCGDRYVAIMLPNSDLHLEPNLYEIQRATAVNFLEDQGVSRDRLLVADERAGLVFNQNSQSYVGGWRPAVGYGGLQK